MKIYIFSLFVILFWIPFRLFFNQDTFYEFYFELILLLILSFIAIVQRKLIEAVFKRLKNAEKESEQENL